jgi:hypothetical protein
MSSLSGVGGKRRQLAMAFVPGLDRRARQRDVETGGRKSSSLETIGEVCIEIRGTCCYSMSQLTELIAWLANA